MNKKYLALIPVLLVLFGCGGGNNGTTSGADLDSEYRRGNDGVVLRFIAENPPAEVFNTYPLTVMIEYRNAGATDITNGKLYLSGFDKKYANLVDEKGNNYVDISGLEGKSIYNPNGLFAEIAEFGTDHVKVDGIDKIDSFDQTIKGTACYEYETTAFADVCIDPTQGKATSTQKVCEVHSVSLSGGQGAPIAITNVDQEMAIRSGQQKVIFKIAVKNVGGGTAFDNLEAGIDNCHSELSYKNVNVVYIDETRTSFSGHQLDCKPDKLRLENGRAFAICSADGDFGDNAYTTPLTITLTYGYRSSIETNVKIINLEE